MGPLVSVIIPIFNAEKQLRRCLDSVLAQRYANLEIILIDDGSTDSSAEICKEYQNKDARIQIIRKNNCGVSASRNEGINKAQGEWICFCDSDDWMEPDLLEALICAVKDDNIDFVASGFVDDYYKDGCLDFTYKAGYSDRIAGSASTLPRDFLYAFRSNHVLMQSPWAKLYKKSIITNQKIIFNQEMVCYEDFSFNITYLCSVKQYVLVNIEKYHYVNEVGVNAILKRSKDDLVNEIHFTYLALNRLFDICNDERFRREMREWLFEAYRVPLIKMKSLSSYKKKKEIIDHLFSDEGYLDLTSFSLTHKFMRSAYRVKLYRLILFVINHYIL